MCNSVPAPPAHACTCLTRTATRLKARAFAPEARLCASGSPEARLNRPPAGTKLPPHLQVQAPRVRDCGRRARRDRTQARVCAHAATLRARRCLRAHHWTGNRVLDSKLSTVVTCKRSTTEMLRRCRPCECHARVQARVRGIHAGGIRAAQGSIAMRTRAPATPSTAA